VNAAAAPVVSRLVATHRVGVIFSGLMLVMLLAALDSTIAATALPSAEAEYRPAAGD